MDFYTLATAAIVALITGFAFLFIENVDIKNAIKTLERKLNGTNDKDN